MNLCGVVKFPSPYGVSFILILKKRKEWIDDINVSVSLRSIIHSYIGFSPLNLPHPPTVSVSLRSIIHSYLRIPEKFTKGTKFQVSVSLRSIIHSYEH